MIRWCRAAVYCLLSACAVLCAGEKADLSFFPYVKTVRMPAAAVKDGMGAVIELDAEVLAQSANPLRECRVFTDSGETVNFVVRKSSGEVRRTRLVPVEAELVMTGENTGRIKTPEPLPTGSYALEIHPENPYFAKFLFVTAVMPSGQERKVLDRASVFSFAPPYPVVRNQVNFFAPAQAELRVLWLPGEEIPQKILRPDDTIPAEWCTKELTNVRIRLFRKETYQENALLTNRYPLDYQIDHTENTTIVAMNASRVPVTGFRVQTGTPFLFRQVKVYGGSGPVDVTLLAEGSLARIAPADRLFVAVPESRYRYYELHIDNREKSPLDDIEPSAEGPRLELLTEAPAENLLKLAYGRIAGSGEFPRHLPEKQVRCLLGKGRRNPAFKPPVQKHFPVIWYWLAGAAAVAGGAAAGVMFLRKRKKEVK
ncbi:MAG: hypothetical protein IKZ31_04575 [Lentisphaeria bacterium]|nr:hypothetical protein [Lentisphaeria bacterium]